ncbi:MAG: BatA domain-containing protein [Tepidisphaeraceae bacterium]
MTFLSPMFAVAGVLLVGIPIAIHLLNRRRYKVLDWAAMQFLLAAMKKNRRRLKFEQWLLLVVRCLVIGLMGLALARPAGCDRSTLARLAGRSATLHVIVVDNSYSMAYEADRAGAKTNFDQAKKLAKKLVDGFSAGGDAVVLITAAKPATAVLAEPTYDLAAVSAAIDRVPQAWAGTDLAGAFELARRVAETKTEWPTKTLDILSDSTASAWRGDQSAAIESVGAKLGDYRIRHFNLSLPNALNAAVLDVSPTTNLVRSRFANDFRATARSFGGGLESSLLWSLNGDSLPGGSAVALDAQTPPQTQSNAQIATGGAAVLSARLSAEDRLPVDNVRYRTLDVAAEMRVLIVEGRRGATALDGSGAFLELALSPPALSANQGRASDSYIKADRISDIELGGKPLDDYRAVLIADVAQIAPTTADALKNYVTAGGTLVWFTGEQVQRESYNAALVPRGLLPGPLAQRKSGPGVTFAFNPAGNNHPLLAAFANLDKSGLDTAQAFSYWQASLTPELKVQTVLAYQSASPGSPGDAAVTLHQIGDGRVVFFASSADAEWTDFPAKPAYVALMHEILAGTISGGARWMNLTVGDRLVLPPGSRVTGTPTLLDPATQLSQPLEQTARQDGLSVYQSRPIDKPGVYTLNTGQATLPISVNVPSDEADLRPVGQDSIRHCARR